MDLDEVKSTYPGLLRKYLFEGKEEEALYGAYMLGKECFEAKIGIEDVMNVHNQCLEDVLKTIPLSSVQDVVLKSSNLLMEFSIRFGLVCQDYFEILQQTDEKIRHAFYQAGEALTAGLDIQKMLSVVVDIVKNLIEAGGCTIMLLEEHSFVIKASEDLDEENKIFKDFLLETINEGKTRTVYDMREEKSRIFLKDGTEIRSVLAIPLNLKGKIIAALGIYMTIPHHFDEKDINLLTSFSCQAASGIDNAHMFSELSRHDRMIKALYDIDRVLTGSLELEEIFNVALSKTLEVTDTEAGTLYSFDGDVLHLEVFQGISPEFKEKAAIRKMGEGIPGIAAQYMKPITMDISQFPIPLLLPYLENFESFMGTPLLSKGKVVGALALGTKKKRKFIQDDLDLLFSIGNMIGIAVENAKLHKDVKDKAKHISALYGIARAAKASLDITELFDAMVVEMRKILSFDRTSINLLRKETVEVFALAGEIMISELGKGIRIPVEKSSTKFIIDRRSGIVRNIEATPFYEDAILFEKGIRSVIQVPLVSKGERIGVLSLESCKTDVYSRRDLDLAQAIADQISNSLENVRLYEELKEANIELEKRLKELEEFQTLAVGRELKMVEMKRRIRDIEGK
jgi:GAF domain-containing protein